ncbi:MAG TPA: ATP-binding protein [Micromonosporaceae bacterium]|nr:ATP-binding protein [Micromonosporaceae bacterium]
MAEPIAPQPGQGSPSGPLLACVFGYADLATTRHALAQQAAAAGLAGQRLDDFVLAVNEILTNAVRHAGGSGRLRLWAVGARLLCEVTDSGRGIPPGLADIEPPPITLAPGGRGLWIARQLCDELTVVTGTGGTSVRLAVSLNAH